MFLIPHHYIDFIEKTIDGYIHDKNVLV